MKNPLKLFCLIASLFFIIACDVRMAPSEHWARWFRTQADSDYYRDKSDKLVKQLARNIEEYDFNKVAVMDLVDPDGRVPILGEYLSSRVIEAVTRQKPFRVAQKGEVKEVLTKLDLQPSFLYTRSELQRLGQALNSQAIMTGRITDLGTNLDANLTLIDVATGEVVSSATQNLNRTRFAVEMFRHY